MAKIDCNIYKDLIDRHLSLFEDESRKNVTFIFKDSDEKIKAHKCILEVASPVFKVMFSGNFAEKDEVKVDDIRPEVFKLLLSGIYLNDIHSQVTKNKDVAVHWYADLYYAAEKYDIRDIRELSKKFLIDNCYYRNTHWLLTKAKLFNLADLDAICKDYFQQTTYDVLARHIVVNLNDDNFHEFFDLDNIGVKSEFDLCMALQAMVDNKVLLDHSKCLKKIRFLTMKTMDILNCKLLSADDKVAIISNIEAKNLRETSKFAIPSYLSNENKPRLFLKVREYERQYFWTAIMMRSLKYEKYFEDFFKQMEISAYSKEGIKALINDGRMDTNEDNFVSSIVINKMAKTIFP